MYRQFNKMRDKFKLYGIDSAEYFLSLQWHRAKMLEKYVVPNVNAQLTLFKAKDVVSAYKPYQASFNHWEPYSNYPIEKYMIPGDHETIFEEPNVRVLAQKLNECLKKIEIKRILNFEF